MRARVSACKHAGARRSFFFLFPQPESAQTVEFAYVKANLLDKSVLFGNKLLLLLAHLKPRFSPLHRVLLQLCLAVLAGGCSPSPGPSHRFQLPSPYVCTTVQSAVPISVLELRGCQLQRPVHSSHS